MPSDTDEPEGGKLSRFTVRVVSLAVGGKVLITMMGCLLCVQLRVPLKALDFQGAEIAFHVSLIQVVIARRSEQQYSLIIKCYLYRECNSICQALVGCHDTEKSRKSLSIKCDLN